MTEQPERCPVAINFGGNLHTRCMLDEAHGGLHIGRGLAQFAYQRINWLNGDRRSYQTERDDECAWEGATGQLVGDKWVYP